jgi:hypothetical protein
MINIDAWTMFFKTWYNYGIKAHKSWICKFKIALYTTLFYIVDVIYYSNISKSMYKLLYISEHDMPSYMYIYMHLIYMYVHERESRIL